MEQPNKTKLAPAEEQGTLARMGAALADWSEKWFPDAYVFAVIAVVVVGIGALAMGRSPMKIAIDFGNGFWTLIPFTMQMAFVVRSVAISSRLPNGAKVHYYACGRSEDPKSGCGIRCLYGDAGILA
jgi:short-chain fatty acids transporter